MIEERIEVLTQSSIRIQDSCTIYADPFQMEEAPHDGKLIFITHDHFDHFSPEDIEKAAGEGVKLVVPEKMKEQAEKLQIPEKEIITVVPGEEKSVAGIFFETVPAYNNLKPFHPKKKGWVGYILQLGEERVYIAGDTDLTKENQKVVCDIAMVPIGGTFTMDAKKAAELVNIIRPRIAIPTHYGSVAGSKGGGKVDEEIFLTHVDKDIKVEIKMQRY